MGEAKRQDGPRRQRRAAQEAAYQFMHAIADDFAGYEEAMRALFANDHTKLALCIAEWPEDVCAYALRLATGAQDQQNERQKTSMSCPTAPRYLEPTQRAGMLFVQRGLTGSVVMLNLLRFRTIADYAANPVLAPASPISGSEAFDRYIYHTLPFLRESGGELLFLGHGGPFLIGPEDEHWHLAMLVRQSSVASFLAFANHEAYLAGIGHRTAALEDSRLLPLGEQPQPM